MTAADDDGARSVTPAPRTRAAIEGLRGVAAIFVVLSHVRIAVPEDSLRQIGPSMFHVGGTSPLYGLFSAAAGTTWFLALGAFLVTARLADEAQSPGEIGPQLRRFWASRLVRLVVPLLPLLVAVLAVDAFDRPTVFTPTPFEPVRTTMYSFGTVLTFTFNWLLAGDILHARAELGHLWFLSVQQQFLVVAVPLIILLHRRAVVLAAAFGGLAVVVYAWRQHVLDAQGWPIASVRTTTRADSLLLGAGAALLIPQLTRWRAYVPWIRRVALVIVAGFIVRAGYRDELSFLRLNGSALQIGVVAFIAAAYVEDTASLRHREALVVRLLRTRPVRYVGRVSYALYLWHYLVIFAVPRLWPGHDWPWNLTVMVLLTAVIVPAAYLLVERPAAGWARRARVAVATPRPRQRRLATPLRRS